MLRQLLAATLFLLVLLAQSLTLQHCATPTPPRGGDRDTIGPVLVADESTPNFQTDFRPEVIRLTFDEWVELDPQQQIFVSPPLPLTGDNRPVLQRRSLVIPLHGLELLDSVTYVFNVGAAVKDLNEGNPTENLRFVFATGPVLDTATVSGRVVDAYTGEGVEGADLTLYANLADSAVFTQNPTYFARTEEEGRFVVSNVKPGRYRVIALQRNPGATDYFADYGGVFPPTAAGFLDSLITVADDNNAIGSVPLSTVPIEPRITGFATEGYGLVAIRVNQPAENVDVTTGREYLRNDFGDTIRLYYREVAPDTILIGRDTSYTDTLYLSGTDAGSTPTSPLRVVQQSRGTVNPGEGLRLVFNRPLAAVDTVRIRLYRDTLPEPVAYRYAIDSLFPAELRLSAGWQDAAPYRLELLPGAVTDWYGTANRDTLLGTANVDAVENYGTLTIELRNLNGAARYILRLLNAEGQVIVGTRRSIRDRFAYTALYTSLTPGTYRMELIYDSNNNGRFDLGDLRFGRQPELVQRFEIEPLRANWEVEKVVDLANK
ncbi:Ig-like domain-containing protein [Neolewinella sp.]|uniref:Ig-like domain-containing protein n=1 Tax=Neolewinella sp. TaxID=2993543 RepID=UPI003B53034C